MTKLTDFLSKGTKKWKDKGQNGLFFLEELVKQKQEAGLSGLASCCFWVSMLISFGVCVARKPRAERLIPLRRAG